VRDDEAIEGIVCPRFFRRAPEPGYRRRFIQHPPPVVLDEGVHGSGSQPQPPGLDEEVQLEDPGRRHGERLCGAKQRLRALVGSDRAR
jgi:hypothetical protein